MLIAVLSFTFAFAAETEDVRFEKPLPPMGTTPREASISLFRMSRGITDTSTQIYTNVLKMDPSLFLQEDKGLCLLNPWDEMTPVELEAVKEWAADITSECTTVDQMIYAVMEYVATNVYYDMDFYNNNDGSEDMYSQALNHNAYDVLTNKTAVCYGYAATVSALLQINGVPCVIIESPLHAWNMAYNGERWVLFDTTWISCNRFENGEFNTNTNLMLEWFDFTIDYANANYNHLITGADYCEYDNTIYDFPAYSTIESFLIPDNITAIENNAFYRADGIAISGDLSNVTYIGQAAFYGCTGLHSVTSLESLVTLGDGAFYGCVSLDGDIDLGNIDRIGEVAFYNCSSIDSVQGLDNVTYVGDAAFNGCSQLSGVINLEKVTYIGETAFYGCASLDGITSLESLTEVGIATFYNCASLDGVVKLGDLENIPEFMFYGCTSLDGIQGEEGIKSIGYGAFCGCTELSGILDLANIQSIGGFSFDSTNLSRVYIPNKEATIESYAFQQCPLTIYAHSNTELHAYAVYFRVPFVDIEELTFTVTYDANGGSSPPAATIKNYGQQINIPDTLPVRSGHEFIAWSTSADGEAEYRPGDAYTENSDLTLYALWKLTVVYGDAQGDGRVDVSDVIFLLQLFASSAESDAFTPGSDVTDDGKFDVSDVIRILQYLASPSTQLGPKQ